MAVDIPTDLFEQLGWHWDAQLRARLEGLTDEEFFWEPAPFCWSVRRIDGRWMPDRGVEPVTPPFTTIAWRMCHIASVLGARASYHFGDRSWSRDSVSWPGTAVDALALVDRCWDAWKSGVETTPPASFEEHSEGPPGSLDSQFPLWSVVLHVNREVIHHGAEVALLRDLWRHTRPEDPFVTACLRGDRDAVRSADAGAIERARAEHPALVLRAVERRNADAVRLLVELGFDVNAGIVRKPLHHASGNGDLEIVRLLVEAGGDLTATDTGFGATPLGWAEYFEEREVAEYLASLTPAKG